MNTLYFNYFPHHQALSLADVAGIWVAAILTLCIFSFLYKDNPLYKLAEHLFVGVSAGYQLVVLYHQYLMVKMIAPLTEYMRDYYHLISQPANQLNADLFAIHSSMTTTAIHIKYWTGAFFYYLLPAIIGLMILTRLVRGVEWMSKYPIAYYVGYGAGMTIMIKIHADILEQLNASVKSLPELWSMGAGTLVSYLIFMTGLACCLAYFYFSSSHRGVVMGTASKIGIWVLMVTFGAQFGFTIMARISLLVGRMQFLFGDWLGLIK